MTVVGGRVYEIIHLLLFFFPALFCFLFFGFFVYIWQGGNKSGKGRTGHDAGGVEAIVFGDHKKDDPGEDNGDDKDDKGTTKSVSNITTNTCKHVLF